VAAIRSIKLKVMAQLFVAESLGLKAEDHQHGKKRLDPWVAKTQGRETLTLNVGRSLQLQAALLPNAAVVTTLYLVARKRSPCRVGIDRW
jgi:hypothetical protein